MSDKEIIIAGKRVGWGTKAKAAPETNVSSTNTFDGAITQGLDKIGWSLEIEKLRFDDSVSYKEFSASMEEMLSIPKMVTIRETIHTDRETYTIVDNFNSCILEGWDYEIKPDDNTAESLKFKCSSRERQFE